MFYYLRFLLCAGFVILPHLTSADEIRERPLVISKSGAEYLRSIQLSRIDADVAYFDPSGPPPTIETGQEPRAPNAEGKWFGDVEGIEVPTLLISAALLIAIAYVFARFGGGFSVSFGGESDNAKRGSDGKRQWIGSKAQPNSYRLDEILRNKDRRMALIQLAQTALMATVTANGVLLQRSWTAREALHHLPANQLHLNALRNLVLASERVHFGGRGISEDEFLSHVNDIRPLLPEAAA